MEYKSRSYRIDDDVHAAIQKLPVSLNQFLRKALTADGVFDEKPPKRISKAQKAVEDLTAQIVEREDIEYEHHESLPRGEHVANLSRGLRAPLLKPSEKKR